jgi:hypothetical protein
VSRRVPSERGVGDGSMRSPRCGSAWCKQGATAGSEGKAVSSVWVRGVVRSINNDGGAGLPGWTGGGGAVAAGAHR